MPASRKLQDSKWRPDKVILPNVDQAKRDAQQFYLEPIDAQKIGWFSIDPYLSEDPSLVKDDDIVRTPSDHMGLIIDLQLKRNNR